jgi:hypothetical protein
MDVLGDRTLLRTGRLGELLLEREDRREDLLPGRRDLLELARREPAVVADRGVADELADLLRVLGSSRIFFESSVVICPTSSTNRLLTRPRTSSSVGSACSSAQFERPRAQKSSSSSKFRSLPFAK